MTAIEMKTELETILHSVAVGDRSIDDGSERIMMMFNQYQVGQQTTIFDPVTHHERNIGKFSGSDYIKSIDEPRLKKQYIVIRDLMQDGKWRTLQEIESKTGYPQASISAQLRNLRKKSFGGHNVEKKRRGNTSSGLFEYKLIINDSPCEHENEKLYQGDGFVYAVCRDCGEDLG